MIFGIGMRESDYEDQVKNLQRQMKNLGYSLYVDRETGVATGEPTLEIRLMCHYLPEKTERREVIRTNDMKCQIALEIITRKCVDFNNYCGAERNKLPLNVQATMMGGSIRLPNVKGAPVFMQRRVEE